MAFIFSPVNVQATNVPAVRDCHAPVIPTDDPPAILHQPEGGTIVPGDTMAFQVEAMGEALTFQWYQGEADDLSNPIAGATSNLLVTHPLFESTKFWVRVSTPEGWTDGVPAEVIIAIRDDLELNGMGDNLMGQMGIPDASFRYKPVRLAVGVKQVSTSEFQYGVNHSLYLHIDNTLWAAGQYLYETDADGTTVDRFVPQRIATDVMNATAAGGVSFMIKPDGFLWAMGYNPYDQLGFPETYITTPRKIGYSDHTVQVAANSHEVYLLNADGTLLLRGSYFPTFISSGVAQVAVGEYHCIFLKTDGTLWAIGENYYGELGFPTNIKSTTVPLLVTNNVVKIAASISSSAFIKSDGTLWYCGQYITPSASTGELLYEKTDSPKLIDDNVVQVAEGPLHSCYIKRDGSLWAMGTLILRGTSLIVSPTQINDEVPYYISNDIIHWFTPEKIADSVIQVSTCAGNILYLQTPQPPQIAVQPESQSIDAFSYATLSVTPAVSATTLSYQWYEGQSGDTSHPISPATSGTFSTRPLIESSAYWVRVSNLLGYADSQTALISIKSQPEITKQPLGKMIRSGTHTFLTVMASGDGLSYQWYCGSSGDTSSPVFGATSRTLVTRPLYEQTSYWVRVMNDSGFVESAAAMIAISNEGYILKGMGVNNANLLGIDLSSSVSTPTQIASDVMSCAGNNYGLTYVTTDGMLRLKGSIGWTSIRNSTPTTVNYASDVVSVDMINGQTVYITTDGTLITSWLCQQYPDQEDHFIQRQVASGVAEVELGGVQSLYLDNDGVLWSVPYSWRDYPCAPAVIESPHKLADGVAQVSMGNYGILFVKIDGTLWSLESDPFGQQRGIFSIEQSAPVFIDTDVWEVSSASSHMLYVKVDGSLWAAGLNNFGQFGNGTRNARLSPLKIAEGVVLARAGSGGSYFIKEDGSLWGSGYNRGQLGDGTFMLRSEPVWIANDVAAVPPSGSGTTFFLQKSPFTKHPLSHSILYGERTTLSCTTSGENFTYQWYSSLDGTAFTPLTGAVDSVYATDPQTVKTYYRVRVYRGGETFDSDSAMITVQGTLQVNLIPAYAHWSIDGGSHWLDSGAVIPCDPEAQSITYETIEGYLPIALSAVDVFADTPKVIQLTYRTIASYASWSQSVFTADERADSAISGLTADPEGTGINNLMRYAFILTRTDSTSPRLPMSGVVEITNEETSAVTKHATLRFTIRADDPSLSWRAESSSDLIHWHFNGDGSGDPIITSTEIDNGDGTVTITAVDPTLLSTQTRCIRIRLMVP